MGNSASNPSTPDSDTASTRSVVRNPIRVLRKSSTNLFKRIEVVKSPLPRELTGTVIRVHQQASSSLDDVEDTHENTRPEPSRARGRSVTSTAPVASQSPSDTTVTEQKPRRPPSSSGTVIDLRSEAGRESRMRENRNLHDGEADEEEDARRTSQSPGLSPVLTQQESSRSASLSPLLLIERDSALSPTIPAPSPLPEDSPHKYGLKDRSDTPDFPAPEDLNIEKKTSRRSSAISIFHEAQSLQTAKSFLNHLSASRRRAESTESSTGFTALTSPRPASRSCANHSPADRRLGHAFKPSGFSYSRPLSIVQLRCHAGHARLLASRNRAAPVECAVCHIDDDGEHYSCCWCALRMCRFCRREVVRKGPAALRDRIRGAEMGCDVAEEGRGRSSAGSDD